MKVIVPEAVKTNSKEGLHMAKLEGFDRIIGMDLSKRTFKACLLTREKNFEDRKIFSGSMTNEGRKHILSQLGKTDVVAIEGGTSSNNFARELEKVAGKVFLLNPGKLHIIFQSQRKTDAADCAKIAKFIRDTHEDNICDMEIPTEAESELRELVNSYNFAKKQRTQLINKLHSIFNMNGYPEVRAAHLKDNESRINIIAELLKGVAFNDALLVEGMITSVEFAIEDYLEMLRGFVSANPEVSLPWLSLPGVGMITCASIMAYIGDCSRFYSAKQLRNYVGLVPIIDQSGDHNWQGGTTSFGCMPVRRNIMQCAWSMDHRKSDSCQLKVEWDRIVLRGKRKSSAAIHVANKLLTIGWTLQKKHELYNGFGDYSNLKAKLRREKLEGIDTSKFPDLA